MGLTLKRFYGEVRVGWVGRALHGALMLAVGVALLGAGSSAAQANAPVDPIVSVQTKAVGRSAGRTRRFLAGRRIIDTSGTGMNTADALRLARLQHVALLHAQGAQSSSLSAAWQPVGPGSVVSAAYGKVSGRVTAIAIDPADPTGNTVYVGTTGGGVWKSVNAAGPVAGVRFAPLTDDLAVFSGGSATASLSIGALSVQNGVVLAGTGDPNDASDSYYGSGVLRSVDGGVTWTLVQGSHDGVSGNHTFVGLGFAGFAWSGTAPGVVVAAVSDAAEGTLVNAADTAHAVRGPYYSTDSGVTWQLATVMDGSRVVQGPNSVTALGAGNAATAVVWNPVRQRFYMALRYHGYYESADGITWLRLAAQPGAGLAAAACLSGQASCPLFRGALAVEPVTGDMFALTVDSNLQDQGLWQDVCAVNGSVCAGPVAFGTRLGGTSLEAGGGSSAIAQGDYNLVLAAVNVPGVVADTALYVGTVDLYKCSLAGGCVLRNTTNATNGCGGGSQVAPAQHAIAVLAAAGSPTGSLLVYVGNDGGVWRSLDGVDQQAAVCSADDATHFDNLNGGIGSLAEVVSFAQHPTDRATLLVGVGANGSAGTGAAGSTAAWPQLAAGEGGVVGIDAANPLLWYVSTGAGVSVMQCARGAACTATDFAGAATVGEAQVDGDAALVAAAWMLDPLQPAELLVGTCRVWRGPAASGTLWSSANAIGADFDGGLGVCGGTSALVRSLGAGGAASSATSAQNAGAQVLYAGIAGSLDGGGTAAGHVFSTVAGGTASSGTKWKDVAKSPVTNDLASGGVFNPGGFDVSSVAVDGHDATGNTVYVTVMGFSGNGINAPRLYGSVDGGAHWTNLSSNLPSAPANSVAVDPNDANTLYLATDTGVYVTTQVATCSTSNCWSIYGTGLPNAPVIELVAAAGMATGDGRNGQLRASTYGRGIWEIPLLTAVLPAAPGLSVTPSSLTFALQAIGTASVLQTVTVTNTGTAPLIVSQVTATGDFHATDTCAGTPVALGGTCAVQVSFQPSSIGARSGVLTVYGNVSGGQATVSLSGTAVAAAPIVLNPVTITFGATTVGTTGAPQNVTISNTGGVVTSLGTISVAGDFAIAANTCGASLAAGVGCTVAITFTPTAAGVRSGVLTAVDAAGTQTVALSGMGTAPATDALSTQSLTFAAQQLNTASVAQSVILTNAGDVALTLISAKIGSGDFVAVNGCGNSLNAHSSCSIAVTYIPKSLGAGSGVLVVADQFRTQSVTLSGSGVAPPGVSLSPAGAIAFAATAVGTTSVAQTVTLTNNGGLPLTVAGVVVTGDFAVAPGGMCAGTIGVGAACTFAVSFMPIFGGPRNGTVTVTDNALNSPQVIALSGTGVDFALTADGNTTVTVANGRSAVFPLLLTSGPTVQGAAVLTCTGVPANATCTVVPANVPLGGTANVSVTVQTGVANSASIRSGWGWLALLVPVGLVFRRRALAVLALCLLAGCGAGRSIPLTAGGGGGGASTPAGTYTLVVSATNAGLVRAVNLTLVVE